MHITGIFCCEVGNIFIKREGFKCVHLDCMYVIHTLHKRGLPPLSILKTGFCITAKAFRLLANELRDNLLVQITSALLMSWQFMLRVWMQINKNTYKWD